MQIDVNYHTIHQTKTKTYQKLHVYTINFPATGEANRLIAWIVRHCGQSSVMTTVARAGSVPLLCSMMHGDYAIMQNEALVALTLMAGSCLGQ